jgi:hypothetical protein
MNVEYIASAPVRVVRKSDHGAQMRNFDESTRFTVPA